ncbi:hypothetical protein [Streptomyces javensis]|uniref:SH3 domain-containing protein n=1 Tax=Streptomyces javensis TaxID=114698 RepID=A0ABN1X7R1_9ACTN
MQTRRLLAGAGAAAAVALGLVGTSSAQAATANAAAVTCGNAYWPHTNDDPFGGRVSASSPAAIHTGPYGDCTTVGHVSPGAWVEYDCYVTNDLGHTWTWVRDENNRSLGWIYDKYLDDGGSNFRCG